MVHGSQDNSAEIWHNERQARLEADKARLDAESRLIETGHNALSDRWNQIERDSEAAHASLDTKAIVELERERADIFSKAQELANGYGALQAQKEQLERSTKLDYETLVNGSSEKSKLFLQVFKKQLEHDPAAMRRLVWADQQVRTSGIPVDSNDYFAAIEQRMGFKPEERKFTFESGHDATEDEPVQRKRETKPKSNEVQLTPEQKSFVKDMNGSITEAEYAAAMKNPFSQAATATEDSEPVSYDSRAHKSMEIDLDEGAPPKQAPVKYKAPNPKTSVTLNPAERELCENMAVTTGRPVNEVLKEFAANKIALRDGKSGHYQLYADKLASEGHR
jgi:hypothetical protein